MSTSTVEQVQWLDCPATGPQDVTAEWRNPSRASFIRHSLAAVALGMEWVAYQRAAGELGYEDKIVPEIATRALACPGCGATVRVWLRGRATSTPAGATHRRRPIDVATGARARRGRCSGVCLNGKRACDCQCNGKCHGAGACRC